MARPAVCELAVAGPRGGLGWLLLLGVCLLGLAMRSDSDCRLDQTWYAGDVHFNERIALRGDGTGTWIQSGHASDAPQRQIEFAWSQSASTLTVTDSERERTVEYKLERRGTHCWLTFREHPFLLDRSGFLLFSSSE